MTAPRIPPPRIPGHLLRWDDAGEPVVTKYVDAVQRFELTPRGWLTLGGARLRGDPGASTLWKVRRDPPGLIPVGRAGEGGPE